MADKMLNAFDVWITAQGVKSRTRLRSVDNISFEGIGKLRELILELAVWGKLRTQAASDEPSQLIVDKITKEKKKLISEGKLRNQVLDIVYEGNVILPSGWTWANIPQVTKNEKYAIKRGPFGSSLRKDFFVSTGYKVYEQQHAIQDDFSLGEYYVDEKKFNELSAFEVKPGDLIISCSGTVGKVAEAPASMEPGIINQALLKLSLNQKAVLNSYFKILFPSFYMKTETLSNLQGTAQKNMVSMETLQTEPFPLPPLAEQHRIVAKVNELMALCDALEQQETQHLKSHQLLVETLLGTLTRAADADEFQQAWNKLYEHFDDLFTTEDSIDQLKQTILQLAVMGKLVPQDPNDEPASELLKKIAKEKDRLFNEGKISKPKALSILGSEEEPFQIPIGWSWTSLGNTGIGNTGKTPATSNSEYFGTDIPFIGPGQINELGQIIAAEKSLTELGSLQSEIANPGDILMVCIGGSIGKSAITKSKLTFNQQINSIRPLFIKSEYLNFAMNAQFFKQRLLEKATGSATPIINRGKWEELPIPIAPLSEQTRIVFKVDELFALCDRLKARIAEAQRVANQMADSILE